MSQGDEESGIERFIGQIRGRARQAVDSVTDSIEDVTDSIQQRIDEAVALYNDYTERINALQNKKEALEDYYNFLVDYEESLESIKLGLESAPYQDTYCDGLGYEEITADISTDDDPEYLYSHVLTYIQAISDLKDTVDNDIDSLWTEIYIFQGYRDEVQSAIDGLRFQLGI